MTKKYGGILKQERENRGITQARLAQEIGVTQQAISNYEHDVNEPTIGVIERIANYYDITLDELVHHEPKKNW